MPDHRIGREEWAAARAELLEGEKELTPLACMVHRKRQESETQ